MDVTTELSELQRRRALLDALQKQSMETPIVGNTGLGQALAKLGTAYFQNKAGQKLADEQSTAKDRYMQQLQGEAGQYLDMMNGKAGQTLSTGQADALMNQNVDPGMLAEPVKADPRRAVVQAMTSQLPEMQAVGKAGFGGLQKQQINPLDVLKLSGYSAADKVKAALTGDLSGLRAEQKEHVIDGRLVTSREGEGTGVAGDFRPSYGPVGPVGRDAQGRPIMGQTEGTTGKAHFAPAGTNISVSATNQAQKEGLGEWSKLAAKTVGELSEAARASNKMLSQLNQVEALGKAGTFTGPGANLGVWMGQLLRAGGVPLDKTTQAKLQNSETFGNTAADLWLASMNANGGSRGLVKEESERIAANLPSLVQTPAGRQQIISVMRQAAQQQIEDAQSAQMEYSKALRTQDPGAFTFGLGATQLPNTQPNLPAPASVTPAGGVMTLDDYLKQMGGK